MTLILHGGEFLISFGLSPAAQHLDAYGAVIKHTDAEVIVRKDWTWQSPIQPEAARPQTVYVRALLNEAPTLIPLDMRCFLQQAHLKAVRGGAVNMPSASFFELRTSSFAP